MRSFPLKIMEADRFFYDGDCESLEFPTLDGQYGIMAGHQNFIAPIVSGTLRFHSPGKSDEIIAVSNGLIKIENGDVEILVETVERPEEIDSNREEKEMNEAREIMLHKKSIMEYRIAQHKMARAMNRLKLKGRER